MSTYLDLIRIQEDYNYSVNLQFDANNDKQLYRFIPDSSSTDMIGSFVSDITKGTHNNHSKLLIGSYGTGKSHFLTVISLLLEKKCTTGIAYDSFIEKIGKYSDRIKTLINDFESDESQKPFLVVPIIYDYSDFDRCIYYSLKKKLENNGISIRFKVFFDQALLVIERWEDEESSKSRLELVCEANNTTISELKDSLRNMSDKAEPIFLQVFKGMTFGVDFIYESTSLVDSLEEANKVISSDYAGIVFLFDEFGRYLENNIRHINVKSIQDLGEYCNHNDFNNHIVLVSHREIGQYTVGLDQSLSDEWKKVEGRYKQIRMGNRPNQCLMLADDLLVKNKDLWKRFEKRYKGRLSCLYNNTASFKGFNGIDFYGVGFPLHPITLFALDRLSKKVAQNERTFFTYLASKDSKSLHDFLRNNDTNSFHFVGVDDIFDYFDSNIKSAQDLTISEIYSQFINAKNKKAGIDMVSLSILKTIRIIKIINDSTVLNADKDTIFSSIDVEKDTISQALDFLVDNRIIKYFESSDRFDFFDSSIFNVSKMISEESAKISDESIVNLLNEEFANYYLYPYSYNRSFRINRVFQPVYISEEALPMYSVNSRFGSYYDGIVIQVLVDSVTNPEKYYDYSLINNGIILLLYSNTFTLKQTVKYYIAAKYLDSKKSQFVERDPVFATELNYYIEDYYTRIISLLSKWENFSGETVTVIAEGEEKKNIGRVSELSELASSIMHKRFPNTLIVNNELLNKNNVSPTIQTAKKTVMNYILSGHDIVDFAIQNGLSVEGIIVRSLLLKNGYITKKAPNDSLGIETWPIESSSKVYNEFNTFISSAKIESTGFDSIINCLKSEPYGLRSGYLSVLLGFFLAPYKKSIVIMFHGEEKMLSAELLEEIIRRPSDYSISIMSWSAAQTDFLNHLYELYSDYMDESDVIGPKRIVDAMMSHYRRVSKYSRTTNDVIETTKLFRKLMERSQSNYSSFVFSKLKSITGDYLSSFIAINEAKYELDNALFALAQRIEMYIFDCLGKPNNTSLFRVLEECYNNAWASKSNKTFDFYTNQFISYVGKLSSNVTDYDVICRLAKIFTGLELDYWSDESFEEFKKQFKSTISKIESYDPFDISSSSTRLIISSSNTERTIVFDNKDISSLGKMVKSKLQSTINNYGLSISYEDKIQILLAIIEDLVEGN